MAGITTNGIGSGLDINDLVSQIVAAEVTPTRQRLDREESSVLARISAFGLVKSALSGLDAAVRGVADSDGFRATSVSSSDEDVLTASSAGGSFRGSYSVDVQRLAENHRLVMATGLGSDAATLGTGTLTIGVGADAFDVVIDGASSSLAGVRDAINDSSGNRGVTASIIRVDDGAGGKVSKLVLTAERSGESSRLTIAVDDDDGGDADAAGLSRLASGQLVDRSPADLDSLIEIDGEPVTSVSNRIDDAVSGLTLTLVSADPGNPVTVSASEDRSAAVEKVGALVAAFNEVLGVLRDATRADAGGAASGPLVGDSTARLMQGRLRAALADEVVDLNSAYTSLAQIGVRTADDGSIELDETALQAALDDDFDGVVSLFTGAEGVAARLGAQVAAYEDFDGIIDERTDGLSARLEDIAARRGTLASRESALEARFLAQFSAMDALVASLQATGDFLARQLDALNARDG